jgi:hypothetical protein
MKYRTGNFKKIVLSILLLTIGVKCYCQYSSVSYYVVAHQDQWQLFMGSNAYHDIATRGNNQSAKKVVLIYTTAGEESCNGAPVNIPYYLARQEGANRCVEFCADQWGRHGTWSSSTDTICGHNILRAQYKNVASYYLKLTGGCMDKGFRGQSLQSFHTGVTQSITAVDSSASYARWDDLVNTMRTIINNESTGINNIQINTADTDQVINPGEHPDHIHTAHVVLDAIKNIPHITLNLYQEYNITNRPVNLDDKTIATKAALLSILDFGRTENGQTSEWTPDNITFISRNYSRTITK